MYDIHSLKQDNFNSTPDDFTVTAYFAIHFVFRTFNSRFVSGVNAKQAKLVTIHSRECPARVYPITSEQKTMLAYSGLLPQGDFEF